MSNLAAQIERYDPREVEAELQNLQLEIEDEVAVSDNLVEKDSEARLRAAREFVEANRELISRQHGDLKSQIAKLRELVNANVSLESADSEYARYLESEDAQMVATQLSEISAMIVHYHDLLIKTGRAGRPPVF
jgi:hypothetical protein